MKRKKDSSSIKIRKALPVLVAASVLTGCVGGQEGDTNGGFAGVGGLSGGAITALGVVGGAVLVGAIAASDSDDDDGVSNTVTNVDGSGDVADGGDAGTGDAGAGDGDAGTGDAGAGDGDAGTGDAGTGDGDAGTGDAGTGDGDAGTGDAGTGDGDAGTGDAGTGDGDAGTGDAGTGGGDAVFGDDGSFVGDFTSAEAFPTNGAPGVATSALMFDTTANVASGCVTVPEGTAPPIQDGSDLSAVTLVIGPPGANGFPGLELEPMNAERTIWCIPANLSADQMSVLDQNLLAGNLSIAVRNNNFPNGQLRTQITPPDVVTFTTTVNNDDGSSANGFVLYNEVTGDYAITWNTSDPQLVSADLNDGIVDGPTENVLLQLSQRASNPARFFAFGNFLDPNDPLPNLPQILADGTAHLDAHTQTGFRRFFGLLTKSDL